MSWPTEAGFVGVAQPTKMAMSAGDKFVIRWWLRTRAANDVIRVVIDLLVDESCSFV